MTTQVCAALRGGGSRGFGRAAGQHGMSDVRIDTVIWEMAFDSAGMLRERSAGAPGAGLRAALNIGIGTV
jgi:hypothetical protein